jgi:hypothetical protein
MGRTLEARQVNPAVPHFWASPVPPIPGTFLLQHSSDPNLFGLPWFVDESSKGRGASRSTSTQGQLGYGEPACERDFLQPSAQR